jgi:hypothetical protein
MSAPTFAKVENGVVTDVRVVTTSFLSLIQRFRGMGTQAIGFTYDAVTDTFTPPEITEIVTETESE